ncbi:MAG TPA: flagellar basal body-associated protein FliL [Blastocatellia bacterium]|nr:flagellar basal body-associated protein FliL [Blastocatellia bacterium]
MAEETQETDQEPAPRKSAKLKIIIVVVLVLGLAGGGFFAFKKFGRNVKADDATTEGKKKEETTSVLHLEPFVVNLADPGGMRYLRVEMSFGLNGELLDAEGKKDKNGDPVLISQVRDAIVQMLSSKSSEQLLSPEGKLSLRDEIKKTVEPFFTKPHITGVFFTDFMVQ